MLHVNYVKVTAEELKARYRAMADGELLAINAEDLQDLARKCLDAELARRSLVRSPPEPSPDPAEEEDLEFPLEEEVPVASFVSAKTAALAESVLNDASIPVRVAPAEDVHVLWVPSSLEGEAHRTLAVLDEVSVSLVEQWLRQTLHGREIMIEDMLAQEDLVAARLTIDGKFQAFCFARIEKSKVAETWHNFDHLT